MNTSLMNSSMMSDSFSVSSYAGGGGMPGCDSSSGGAGGVNSNGCNSGSGNSSGIMVEEVGTLILGGDVVPKKMVMLNYTLAILSDDGRLVLGEIRSRGGDDWALSGRSMVTLNDHDKRYLDLALVPNVQGQGHVGGLAGAGSGGGGSGSAASLVFLNERLKNKERSLTAHNIRHGKVLELKEEFSAYDKVNVLGKGVSHIASVAGGNTAAADASGEAPTVYAVSSNLVRKLRLEDSGTNLKPTTARAQVPADCQDGTLAICVQSVVTRRPSTATTGGPPSSCSGSGGGFASNNVNVIVAFRTKSAGKNKYTIEYYNSKNKGDEIFNSKASIKLGEEAEPTVLLNDPKDSRNVYALCVNKNNGTTALFKISKGKRADDPIRTFNYEIRSAAMSFSADKTVILVTYDAIGDVGRIYTIQKTEGYRGRHPLCPAAMHMPCPSLEPFQSSSHIVSCASVRWQLSQGQVEHVVGLSRPIVQLALATLVENGSGRFVTEPEAEAPYRLRVIGCEAQSVRPELMLMDDLERVFDGEEHRLANSVLKICLGHSPNRDCHSKLSALLMAGRLYAIELYYVKPPSYSEENIEAAASDRFVLKPITVDKFRSLVSDVDWTQLTASSATAAPSGGGGASSGGGRQGTFTLEDQDSKQRPQTSSATLTRGTSPRSSGGAGGGSIGGGGGLGSRIPTPRTSVERTPSGRLSSASGSVVSGIPTAMSTSVISGSMINHHGSGDHHHSAIGGGGSGSNGHSLTGQEGATAAAVESEKVQKLRAVIRSLQSRLSAVLEADATVRSNLHGLRDDIDEAMAQTEGLQTNCSPSSVAAP